VNKRLTESQSHSTRLTLAARTRGMKALVTVDTSQTGSRFQTAGKNRIEIRAAIG
jgi:hypothetical protein